MTDNLKITLCVLFSSFLLMNCEKNAEPINPTVITGNSYSNKQMAVSVKHFFEPGTTNDSMVSNALVELYLFKDSLQLGVDQRKVGRTNQEGKLQFQYLFEEYYFVKVSHDILGIEIDSVYVPTHAAVVHLDLAYF